jgi:hypothetical protein
MQNPELKLLIVMDGVWPAMRENIRKHIPKHIKIEYAESILEAAEKLGPQPCAFDAVLIDATLVFCPSLTLTPDETKKRLDAVRQQYGWKLNTKKFLNAHNQNGIELFRLFQAADHIRPALVGMLTLADSTPTRQLPGIKQFSIGIDHIKELVVQLESWQHRSTETKAQPSNRSPRNPKAKER